MKLGTVYDRASVCLLCGYEDTHETDDEATTALRQHLADFHGRYLVTRDDVKHAVTGDPVRLFQGPRYKHDLGVRK